MSSLLALCPEETLSGGRKGGGHRGIKDAALVAPLGQHAAPAPGGGTYPPATEPGSGGSDGQLLRARACQHHSPHQTLNFSAEETDFKKGRALLQDPGLLWGTAGIRATPAWVQRRDGQAWRGHSEIQAAGRRETMGGRAGLGHPVLEFLAASFGSPVLFLCVPTYI